VKRSANAIHVVSTTVGASKGQLRLYKELQHLFPSTPVQLNYYHEDMRYLGSKRKLELDVSITIF
jgi:hypothetical protein